MTGALPVVDVNLFAFNAEATLAVAIESVLAQTWPAIRLTVIDNASTDRTADIARDYCAAVPHMRLHRARANGGAVLNCQRAFLFGDADFVMPKTADDLIEPRFVERAMELLLAHRDCAMAHARGLMFAADGALSGVYPAAHALHAVGPDPLLRCAHVMRHYTSAPSFWGVYRRAAVDRLSRFRYRAGWDHATLAELALLGEIRHVPEVLYLRRGGGKPVARIARSCTEAAQRGLPHDDALGDLRWITPLITTTHAHFETFAVAPLPAGERVALMQAAHAIFVERWGRAMQDEAATLATALPALRARAAAAPEPLRAWMRRQIVDVVAAAELALPGFAAPGTDGPSGQHGGDGGGVHLVH